MPFAVVFFDFGGTLVEVKQSLYEDSARCISSACHCPCTLEALRDAELEEWGHRPPSNFRWVRSKGQEREYWRDFYASVLETRLGIPSPSGKLIEMLMERRMDPHCFFCFQDGIEILDDLERIQVHVGLISNAFPSARDILDHFALKERFRWLILSYEGGHAKPEGAIYRHARDEAGVPSEQILFVDDRPEFISGAEVEEVDYGRALLIDRDNIHPTWEGSKISSLSEVKKYLERSA